jgi:hypothetical protein
MIAVIVILLLLVVLGGMAYYFTRPSGDVYTQTEPVMKSTDAVASVAKNEVGGISMKSKLSQKPMKVTFYDKPECTGNTVTAMVFNKNVSFDSSFNLKSEANQPKVCCMKFENVKMTSGLIKNDKVNMSFSDQRFPESVINVEGCSNNYEFKVAPLE